MPPKRVSVAHAFQELRADYRAAKDTRFVSRLTGVAAMGSGADYHYRTEAQWLHMLERARHYQRNDQVVGQGVRRVVANIVQEGFTLDVDTGDPELDVELKARWEAWSTDPDECHSEGEHDFAQLERLALSSTIVDGDCFVLPLRSGRLQCIEAHRCRTPRGTSRNVVHGVMLDESAKRTEYWFTREDLGLNQALTKVSDVLRYAARDAEGHRQVYHLYAPDRFSQRRGVTAIAPVSDTVGMHDDVQFATLVKSQMASMIAILHERGPNWQPGGEQQKGDRYLESAGGYTKTMEGVSAGLEIFGDIDEKLSAFSPGIPSPEFFPHTMLLLTFIAINLDIPVHVLLLDPSRTNFSGWRGAIDQARLRFRQIQAWLASKFHTQVYRWWLRRQIASDPIFAAMEGLSSVRIFRHRWNPPTFAYLEPLKDGQADDLQVNRCLNSRRRIQASRGRDWEEVSAEIIADNAMLIRRAIEAAREIESDFPGASVNWRELVAIPMASAASASIPIGGQPAPQPFGDSEQLPDSEDDSPDDEEDDTEDPEDMPQTRKARRK